MAELDEFEAVTVEQVMLATGVDRATADRQMAELMLAIGRAVEQTHRPVAAIEVQTTTLKARTFTRPPVFAAISLKNRESVSVILRNSASGEGVTRNVGLDKTVAEVLMFDSLNLFPEVITPDFRVANQVVTLARENRRLEHWKTLRDNGVQANDMLEISVSTYNPNTRNEESDAYQDHN